MEKSQCSVDDCCAEVKTRGLCGKHDQRLRRHGDTNTVKPKGGLRPGSANTPEKFWSKVLRAGDNDCWPWALGRDRDGYGEARWQGKQGRAHRVAFLLTHGSLPEAVLHNCDNPPCCNPNHLRPGTNRSNTADRVVKGRSARGESVNTAQLTEAQVRDIKSRDYTKRGTKAAAAREFGITKTSIGLILSGKNWKHVK